MKHVNKFGWDILGFSLIFLCILSCSKEKKKSPAINEDIFVQLYCDVVSKVDLLEAKKQEAFVDSLLNHYQITRESFSATVKSYSAKPEKWEKVFEKIVAELEKRAQEIDKPVSKPTTTIPTPEVIKHGP